MKIDWTMVIAVALGFALGSLIVGLAIKYVTPHFESFNDGDYTQSI